MNEIFDIIGLVDDLDDFYRRIDIAINPMVGGTGLKIKSLEALSYGKALLATEDAMVGIPSNDAYHKAKSITEMVGSLAALSNARYELLLKNSKDVFDQYNGEHISNFKTLFGWINGFSDLMVEVFGEKGKHARAAIGVATLPRGQAVEIELVVEVYE